MAAPASVRTKLDRLSHRVIDFLDLAIRLGELSLIILMVIFFMKLTQLFFGQLPGAL